MHEVAAMQGAVNTALERMRDEGAARVTRVTLVLGVSGHLAEDAARQYFALFTKGTPAEHASLDISWLPATYQCFECLHRFTSDQPPDTVLCPQCGGLALEVTHHDECYVSEIEVAGIAEARDNSRTKRPGLQPGARCDPMARNSAFPSSRPHCRALKVGG